MQMFKRNLTLIGIVLGIVLLVVATFYYPGGTDDNPASVGYEWKNNYITNLLNPQALNGMANTARPWAVAGVFCLSAAFGVFFIRFSERIPIKSAANVIKYVGTAAAFCAFLTIIPSLHDKMVLFSGVMTLLVFFYITVFVFQSKLLFWKVYSVVALATLYFATFMYFGGVLLAYLAIMQKVVHLLKFVWIVGLEYGTDKDDFAAAAKKK